MRLRNGRRRQVISPVAALTELFESRRLLAVTLAQDTNAVLRSAARSIRTEITVVHTTPTEGFDLAIDEVRLTGDEIHVFSTILNPKRHQYVAQVPVTHRKSVTVSVPRADMTVRYHTAPIEIPRNELYLLRSAGTSTLLYRRADASEATAWPITDVEPHTSSTVELNAIPAPAAPRGQVARPIVPGSVGVDFLLDEDPVSPQGISGDHVRRYELQFDRGGWNYPDHVIHTERSREFTFLGDRIYDGIAADGTAAQFGGEARLNLDYGIYSFRVRKQVLPIFPGEAVGQNAMGSQWSEWTDWSNFTLLPEGQKILLMPVVADGVTNAWTTWPGPDVSDVVYRETQLPNGALPEFHWSPVADAASYELWIDSRWNAKKVIHTTGLTGSGFTLSQPLELGQYRAWIRATRQDGTRTAWSPARNFQIAAPELTIEPVTDEEDTTPTIRWSGTDGAKSFSITVREIINGYGRQDVYRMEGLRSSSEHTLRTPLRKGRAYRVEIIADFGRDMQTYAFAEFALTNYGLPTIGEDQRTIRWQSAPDSTGYDVWVAYLGASWWWPESNSAQPNWNFLNEQANTHGVVRLPDNTPGGHYRVWVRRHPEAATDSTWSEPIDWTVSGPSQTAIKITGNSISWQPVDGVTSYNVEVTRKTNRNWGSVDSSLRNDRGTWAVSGTVTTFPEGILPGEYDLVVTYQRIFWIGSPPRGYPRFETYTLGRTTHLHHATGEAISGLKKVDSEIVWDWVHEAQNYEVQVYSVYSGVRLLSHRTDLIENSYQLLERLGAGEFRILVRARKVVGGNEQWTAWSRLDFAYGQRTPTNIRFDGSVLHWTGHHTDLSYRVKLSILSGGVVRRVSRNRYYPGEIVSYVNQFSDIVGDNQLDLREVLPEIRQFDRSVRLSVQIQSSTWAFRSGGYDGDNEFIPDENVYSPLFDKRPTSDWSVPFEFGLPTFNASTAPIFEAVAQPIVPLPPTLYTIRTYEFGTLRILPLSWISSRGYTGFEELNLRDANGYGLDVDVLPRFEFRATNKLTGNVITLDDADFMKSDNIRFDNLWWGFNGDWLHDDGRPVGYADYHAASLTPHLIEQLSTGVYEIQTRIQYIPVVGPGQSRPLTLSFAPPVRKEPLRINLTASPWSDWSSSTDLVVAPPDQFILPFMKVKETTDPRPVFQWGCNFDEASYELSVVNRATGQQVIHQFLDLTKQFQPQQNLAPGVYDWKVRLTGPYPVDGTWSELQTVEIYTATPVATSVSEPTVDATPSVSWIPYAESTDLIVQSYSVEAMSKSTGLVAYSGTATAGERTHRIAQPLPNGTYRILVQAHFVNGARSAPGKLRADGGYELPEMIIGAAPSGVSASASQVSWNAVPGATQYQIWITWMNPRTGRPERIVDEAVYSTLFRIPTARVQRRGEYRVWIRAVRHEEGNTYTGNWSTTTSLRIV